MSKNLDKLQKRINYKFKNVQLLEQAMMHTSYTNERHLQKYQANERLEFLGDAVLELISSEFLFTNNKTTPEGELTKTRASIVCEQSLAFCAREIQLGDYLLLGRGEEVTGGRKRDSVTSDALEALIGAIYLDSGYECAKTFVKNFVLNDLDNKKLFYDSKTILQELVQGTYADSVIYKLIKEEGPDHDKTFESIVSLKEEILGSGQGRTKKLAEQKAAYQAILELKKRV